MPLTLTAIAASHSPSSIASKRPPWRAPYSAALLMRPSSPAEFPDGGLDHRQRRPRIGNIERGRDAFALLCGDEIECRAAITDIGNHDAGTRCGKGACKFLAEPTRGAGN